MDQLVAEIFKAAPKTLTFRRSEVAIDALLSDRRSGVAGIAPIYSTFSERQINEENWTHGDYVTHHESNLNCRQLRRVLDKPPATWYSLKHVTYSTSTSIQNR